tara:strand:+ start:1187 stop:1465 length:279 start_codon:yes stop_codon:yes gene_type:complete
MAVTKTSKIESIHIHYWDTVPTVEVMTSFTWDDPNDDQLPISNRSSHSIKKMTSTTTYNENTGEATTTESPTDYSGEDPKVIAVCDLVWPTE